MTPATLYHVAGALLATLVYLGVLAVYGLAESIDLDHVAIDEARRRRKDRPQGEASLHPETVRDDAG